jgi:hypothetical protein
MKKTFSFFLILGLLGLVLPAIDHYIPALQSSGTIDGHQLSAGPIVGGKWQSVYEQSATQNFPIGTRLQIDDRVFRYCQAKGTTAVAMKAGHNGTADLGVNTYAEVYAIGETHLRVEDTAVRAANFYKDGYVWIMDLVSGVYQMHKIASSEAAIAADDHVHITLQEGLAKAVPASTFVTIWPNPYSNILFTTNAYSSMVCVPLIPLTTDYYFWGQTWGPCFGTAMSALPGAASGDRAVFFNSDGALINGASLTTNGAQLAGFVITMTSGGGDQFYQLQLAP